MKTDLNKLAADLKAAVASLAADANEKEFSPLLGHALSGLRGAAASIEGHIANAQPATAPTATAAPKK